MRRFPGEQSLNCSAFSWPYSTIKTLGLGEQWREEDVASSVCNQQWWRASLTCFIKVSVPLLVTAGTIFFGSIGFPDNMPPPLCAVLISTKWKGCGGLNVKRCWNVIFFFFLSLCLFFSFFPFLIALLEIRFQILDSAQTYSFSLPFTLLQLFFFLWNVVLLQRCSVCFSLSFSLGFSL